MLGRTRAAGTLTCDFIRPNAGVHRSILHCGSCWLFQGEPVSWASREQKESEKEGQVDVFWQSEHGKGKC